MNNGGTRNVMLIGIQEEASPCFCPCAIQMSESAFDSVFEGIT